ncbi:MAG: putative two-component system protein hydrogenase maturation factor HypX/HoxX [Solirubrobacteraceae bacterium]|nr:putative two-component system protein hydrogenase maturation factor HypX/HoxX [Solirubrobacteraceae bacterium]
MAAAPALVFPARNPIPDLDRGVAGSRSVQTATRVLFLVSAHNSLSQRAYVELAELGHEISVAVVDSAIAMEAAVARHRPQLIVCPMLKTFIPQSIWEQHRCLVVHPGPMGDRGASSLDWAIELGMDEWGVTVLEANGDFDGGDVWATRNFPTRAVGKSSLYRHEVRHAAIEAIVEAVGKLVGGGVAQTLDYGDPRVTGRKRPLMKQDFRAIDWSSDATDAVIRKIRAAEGHPGVLDDVHGMPFHLFGVHREQALCGSAGEIVAQRNGAICRATVDGAVWITHLKPAVARGRTSFKLPATRALELAGHDLDVPEIAVALHAPLRAEHTYREISYEEDAGVGYLHFDFYNGAMSTEQCRRLRAAYLYARSRRQTKVIVLMGGSDFFSNGIHLNVIEAAGDPGAESWRNLHAIDDVVHDIIQTDSHVVISALGGDAAAGGVPFALAADQVVAREDVVLNPYYQHMGGLYGSEYWTYLLPGRVGAKLSEQLTGAPFEPVGTRRAVEIGLLDAAYGATLAEFHAMTRERARQLARDPELRRILDDKRSRRALDEQAKPLQAYRDEEMARSHQSFFGRDSTYHNARWRFVHKVGTACAATELRLQPR